MRKRNLKRPYYRILLVVVMIVLVSITGFLLYLANSITTFLSFNDHLGDYPYVDGLKSPDYALLEMRSAQFEERVQKYHNPNGSILGVTFADNNLTMPRRYSGQEDTDIWTGTYIGGEAFRWAVAHRTSDLMNQTAAERSILKSLQQFEILLEITGIPGALARYACFGSQANYDNGLWDEGDTLVETGKYAGWRFFSYISKDQLNGVLFGYGCIYKLVENSTIRNMVARQVDLVITYLESTHWQGIDEDGANSHRFVPYEPTPLRTPSGSRHILAYLNIARMINFTKYDPLYRKYARDWNYALKTTESSYYSIINGYFAFNINILSMFNLVNLENDLALREIYFQDFNKSIYEITQYHRNSFFNVIYLALAQFTRTDRPSIVADVADGLQRFAESHYPNRRNAIYNSNASDYNDIVDQSSVELVEKMSNVQDSIYVVQRYAEFQVHTKVALPVDRRYGGNFIWQRSPFDLDYPSSNNMYCDSGIDYLVVYWMARYYNYIPNGQGVFA